MDPVSALAAVLSITITIKTWLDNNSKKNDFARDLSTSVNLVYTILSPLQNESKSMHLDSSIVASLLCIGEVLSRIMDHLSLWKDKRMSSSKILGFLNPSSVIDDLRDDTRLLSQHIQATSLALHVYTFLAERDKIQDPPSQNCLEDTIKNPEVARFWRDMIGENTPCVSGKIFCESISKWLNTDINESFRSTLLLRIDEFAIGGVTASSIDRFVGNRTLNDTINHLKEMSRTPTELPRSERNTSLDQPWLIWVDDNVEHLDNIRHCIAVAIYMGVAVFTFTSTASAKAWIDANEEHLRRRDNGRRLRFITDNTRWESHTSNGAPTSGFLNLGAGEAIIRFLRGRQYIAPVLVYAYRMPLTSYVVNYKQCGSTRSIVVCLAYIASLAHGEDHDRRWEQIDAGHDF